MGSCFQRDRPAVGWCRRHKRFTFVLVAGLNLLILAYYLHTEILPRNLGYYNDECYLSAEKRSDMRYLLTGIIDVWTQLNQTFWVDFGTLLGIVRDGDVLRHDADVDICRLLLHPKSVEDWFQSQATRRLNSLGITTTAFIAKYKSIQADLFRWEYKSLNNSNKQREFNPAKFESCIRNKPSNISDLCSNEISKAEVMQWWPFKPSRAHQVGMFLQGGRTLPATVILPVSYIPVSKLNRTRVPIPRETNSLLRKRYGMFWKYPIPYKWKCWL